MPRDTQKEKVSRISFSLQPQLQRDFDRISRLMGYEERSMALRIAIQNLINDYELKVDPESIATGTILMIYDHDVGGVDNMITDIGHTHRVVIVSSLHLHLDEENCLNIIVVKGKVNKIVSLEQDVRKLNGVKQLKYAYLVVGK